MPNLEELKQMVGETIYHRGLGIYQSGGVLSFEIVSDDKMFEQIEATVQGSGRKRYYVELIFSNVLNELVDYFCECPAFFNYEGPCKHCTAAALKYIDYQQGQGLLMPPEDQEQTDSKRKRLGSAVSSKYAKTIKEPVTTPALKQILGNQIFKRSLPVIQKEIFGKVALEPALHLYNGELTLDFRIGMDRKYVVKDLFKFADMIYQNVDFSYGKKLGFIHDITAFESSSKPLVNYILWWIDRNGRNYIQSEYYGYAYQSYMPKLRNISLSGDELDHFIDAMGGGEFTAEVNGQRESKWKVSETELLWKMSVSGKEKGIEVEIDILTCIVSENYLNIFKEGMIYRILRKNTEQIRDFIECLLKLAGSKAFIHKADISAFCRELLPALENFFQCSYDNFSKEDYGVEEVSFEIYLDAPQEDMVSCQVKAVYGEKSYNVYGEHKTDALRDVVKELEVGSQVSCYCNAYDEQNACMVLADDEDKLYELLTVGLAEFALLGKVFVSEALKRVKVASSPRVELGIALTGDLLELSMTAEDIPLEQLREILSKYNKRKKYYRLKNGDFVDMEGGGIRALLEVKETLGLTDAQIKEGKAKVPKFRALYLDEESKEWESLSFVKNRNFRGLVRNMKTVEDNDYDIPASMDGVLREYQKKGFLWLKTLKHNGFGAILADDMGLGKTLQVIAFFQSEYKEKDPAKIRPVLIVCPASLVYNWSNEMDRFAPELPVRMIVGTAEERAALLKETENGEILITSYDLLRRDLDIYENMDFSCQVIDEAQYIKNHNTQASKAVKGIKAGFKLALTGTPIENRLSELWSIFDYIMPGFLHSYQRFKSSFEAPIVQEGGQKTAKRLQKLIRPFILRRLKRDVLKDLPEKLEENMYVRLEGEQQKLYDAHVKRLMLMLDKHSDEEFRKNKIQVLSELTRLRQICCDPALIYSDYTGESAKARLCIDMIKNAVNGGHKLLLFSQFTTMLSHLCASLKEENISFYVLTGAVSKERRRKMVEAFQKDDTSVFCISLKAGGTGLNLTAADMVVHYDPWWNLAVQNQATDRVHRIGQKNVVNVYRLIVKDTIEEKIVKLQEKKKELAEQLLDGEGMDSTDFSREELLELLK